eukprot:gene7645-biopygen9714
MGQSAHSEPLSERKLAALGQQQRWKTERVGANPIISPSAVVTATPFICACDRARAQSAGVASQHSSAPSARAVGCGQSGGMEKSISPSSSAQLSTAA